MIQETAVRLSGDAFAPSIIICGRGHFELADAQLSALDLRPQTIVLEPMARNTAAVAAVAALAGQHSDPEALVLLVPADHVIAKPDAFRDAILAAAETAKTRIVTFGIRPTHPETGFGYIEHGGELGGGIYEIKRFLEKPNLETAMEYVRDGRHDWNAGIFLFSPRVMLEELNLYAPEVLAAAADAWQKATRDDITVNLDADAFVQAPSISIDYAVMEKTQRSAVIPCEIGWADVGGFAELWRLGAKDEAGNHARGKTILIDARNCLIQNHNGPAVAVIGLENLMVISTSSGVLVCPLDRAQDVKKAAEAAKTLD
jgi:mannose-1-phosphate guanylyltransferase/mannose-6-phosphate isomerase